MLRKLSIREFGNRLQPFPTRVIFTKNSMKNLNLHNQILGHLGELTCVAFDKSGRYIITCGYDSLIKVNF